MSMHDNISDKIIETPLGDALSERYLAYALSTIMSRSLPDVRDGLKPVHRRLLYAMRLLKLEPKLGYKKCARVVGDVIGKYHPHGDQSVYDALTRLAQDFSVRYPLIDGQGNFGNIDGDNAAAMRYTEAKLTEVAMALMAGLEEDSVDFQDTYDGEESEPLVFPGGFPNILANGATGIAVGMATSIPPHNVGELADALQLLINGRMKGSEVRLATVLGKIPGPDFPTGGVIVETPESLALSYETGRGSIRLRSKYEVEDIGHGQYVVVVTEIPYQVQKSRLIEKIADLIQEKRLPILTDVRDESSEDIRIVLEPKNRTVDVKVLMETLFRLTDLEVRFPMNMNMIDINRRPNVLSIKDVLEQYLDHQKDVLERRSRYRLEKVNHRMEILSGYLIAYLNLDEVIRIIREHDDAKEVLMDTFKLTETQAEAILNMRLRSLRKLEEIEIRTEHSGLDEERSQILALLGNDMLQWAAIGDDVALIKKQFGQSTALGKRRSQFAIAPVVDTSVSLEAMIEKEPITVICSKRGWIRGIKGHMKPEEVLKYKDGDSESFRFSAYTTDKIFLFSTSGRIYTLGGDKLPSGRGHGEPVRLLCDMENNDEVVALMTYMPGSKLLLASSIGKGYLIETDTAVASKKAGKQVLNLTGTAIATHCLPIASDSDMVAVIGENRKLLVFKLDELPVMNRGQGVTLQRYKQCNMADITLFNSEQGLSWPMGGEGNRTRTETELTPWSGKRGNAGRLPPMGFPRNNKFSG